LGRCFAHFVPDKLTLLPIPGSVQRDRAKGDRKEERGGIASFPPEASCTIDLLPAFLHRRKDLSMAIGACQTDLQILTTQDALSSRWKVGAGSARTVPDRRPGAPHDHPCHEGDREGHAVGRRPGIFRPAMAAVSAMKYHTRHE